VPLKLIDSNRAAPESFHLIGGTAQQCMTPRGQAPSCWRPSQLLEHGHPSRSELITGRSRKARLARSSWGEGMAQCCSRFEALTVQPVSDRHDPGIGQAACRSQGWSSLAASCWDRVGARPTNNNAAPEKTIGQGRIAGIFARLPSQEWKQPHTPASASAGRRQRDRLKLRNHDGQWLSIKSSNLKKVFDDWNRLAVRHVRGAWSAMERLRRWWRWVLSPA